jgi:arylsulfatase A-like enzyme
MPLSRREACLALAAGAAAAQDTPPRPNIVWITSEDNGPFLGCFGDSYARTPHLDRLASQGTLYENAFAAFPVCAPSRCTLITGVWANSAGTAHMRSMVPLSPTIRMFPELLRKAGYYCTNNVKQDYNTTTPDTVWDESSNKATYRKRAPNQPFFHVINFTSTHESSMFQQRPLQHDPAEAPHRPYHPDNAVFRRDWAQYADNVSRMDAQVGEVLAQLEADGLVESTIVFYFSDHGGVLPRSKRFVYDSGIHVPLIIRIPERYRQWAPTRPGGRTDRLVSFVDFAPSVLSLAGVPVPDYMQGQAFLGPQAKAQPRDFVFAVRDRMGPCPDLVRAVRDKRFKYIHNYFPGLPAFQYDSYSMGIPSWANIWALHREGKLTDPAERRLFEPKPAEELYDTRKDPHEVNNLAGKPEYRRELQRLRAACDAWLREIRDVSFIPEVEMHRLSAGSTPYDFARDARRYPVAEVTSLARTAAAGVASNLPVFMKHLNGPDTVLQYWAVQGCRVLGSKAEPARAALAKVMQSSPAAASRIAAAEVLCRLGVDRAAALAVLQGFLSHEEPWTRVQAAVTLGWLGPLARPALAALEKAATDKENYPKLSAQNALLYVKGL